MDRELPHELRIRKRRRLVLLISVPALLLVIAIMWFRAYVNPSIRRFAISTAVVEKGDMENTLNASGIVLPEFEETITSPIEAGIRKVLADMGSKVQAGKPIIILDKAAAEAGYKKLKFQLETRRSNMERLSIDGDRNLYRLRSNNDIKQLQINSLQASAQKIKRLFDSGIYPEEDVRQAELNLQVALLEKKQLENDLTGLQQSMKAEMKESMLAEQIQQGDLDELTRKLRLADIVAGRAGVVTWINKNIGTTVKEGEPLARIADLSSFKVTGSISDNYIDQLYNGMKVIVRVNETKMSGKIVNIYPAIQNGIVKFDIALAEKNNSLLRPEMKVDVFPVTAIHNGVLRIANGPAFRGANTEEVFVVDGSKAVRRTVHTGLTNFDHVEILDNVKPGDVIITSDMSSYKRVAEIEIKN
jgi:HlyD family secretion protein